MSAIVIICIVIAVIVVYIISANTTMKILKNKKKGPEND